jgi:signal-transduction protein with cAMP-binding, CBS, and nucleotidyltransferase domain
MVDEFMDWATEVHVCDPSCPVEHVMGGAPVVDPEYTVRMTAQTMIIAKAGTVVVYDAHRPMTIVTEHDLIRALSDGVDPDVTRITEVASTLPDALGSASTISDAVRHMSETGTRHVWVKADGNVVGLATADDFIEVFNGHLPSLTRV